jgi:hypothetical protein
MKMTESRIAEVDCQLLVRADEHTIDLHTNPMSQIGKKCFRDIERIGIEIIPTINRNSTRRCPSCNERFGFARIDGKHAEIRLYRTSIVI